MSNSSGAGADDGPLRQALASIGSKWPRPVMDRGDLVEGYLSAEALFDDGALIGRLLEEQRRVTSAYLTIAYGNLVAIPAVGLLIGFGMVPDLAPERIGLKLLPPTRENAEKNVALRFLSAEFTTDRAELAGHPDANMVASPGEMHEAFRHQVEAHFRPLVTVLSRRSGLAASALWRLVTDSLAGVFLEAGRRFGCEEQSRAIAMTVLKQPGSPLKNREMHSFDISICDSHDEERILVTRAYRARGGCCRYYTSKEGHLCTTCVLHSDGERRRLLEASLRSKLGLAPAAI